MTHLGTGCSSHDDVLERPHLPTGSHALNFYGIREVCAHTLRPPVIVYSTTVNGMMKIAAYMFMPARTSLQV